MPNKKLFCFDGGGSKWGFGTMESGKLIKLVDFTAGDLDQLKRQFAYKMTFGLKPSGIAIATAGVIVNHRMVKVSPNIHWLDGVDLVKWADDNWGVPCVVSNDMEAAVAGEMAFGNLKGIKNALMFTISTGFGGAMVVDGKIIISEPGHMRSPILIPNGTSRLCGCGKMDCVEAHLSGGAVRDYLTILVNQALFGGDDPCAYLDKKAAEGVPWATNIYDQVGAGIGEFWASAINLFSATERIVYMGTFGIRAMPFMAQAIKKAMYNRAMFEHHRKLLKSSIDDDYGLIFETALEGKNALYGAAAVYEEVLGEHYTV